MSIVDLPAKYQDKAPVEAGALPSGAILGACRAQLDALLQHPWAPLLARDASAVTLADLEGFYRVADLYVGPAPLTVVDPSVLGSVMATLGQTPDQPLSLWERALHWVLDWLGGDEQSDAGWLKDLSISETLVRFFLYACLALIVLLALAVILTEFRHVSFGRRMQDSRWEDEQLAEMVSPGFDQLLAAPLRDQPGLLLAIILARLQAIGVLQMRSSATHRDIATAVQSLQQGEAVASISEAAERATFGDWHPRQEDMAQLLQTGRRICKTLDVTVP